MRVEICGNIASGKTTLCAGLLLPGSGRVFEAFEANPFLGLFYEDPEAFSFETELVFLLQHYNAVKICKDDIVICDNSFFLDLAYADVNLAGKRREIFEEVVEELLSEISWPDVVISLNCPEDVLLRRIVARNRGVESSITISYLEMLTQAIAARVASIPSNVAVIPVDSNAIDFNFNTAFVQDLGRLISRKI